MLSLTAALRTWIYPYLVTTINGYPLWNVLKRAATIRYGKFIIFVCSISFFSLCNCYIYFSFYARDSGFLKFRIYAGSTIRTATPPARRLAAFTFHPTDPFAISVQRTNGEYVVNFHVRHDNMLSDADTI